MFKQESKTKTYCVESTDIITKDGVITTNNEDFNSILNDGDIVVAFGNKIEIAVSNNSPDSSTYDFRAEHSWISLNKI